jgi:hypothetical protein
MLAIQFPKELDPLGTAIFARFRSPFMLARGLQPIHKPPVMKMIRIKVAENASLVLIGFVN